MRNCVNPGHLFLGTNADNVRDRDAKGRLNIHGQKLNNESAKRVKYATGTLQDIAKRFNLHVRTVERIKDGDIWKHV